MTVSHYVVLRAGARPRSQIEIKKSRFLGYAARTASEDEARDFLALVRREHREARHVCHAFVLGPDRSIQRSSDDAEPSGTAGVPILKAIAARQTSPGLTELSDMTVAVVRYFGGIKLGAGGLVQAYSEAAAAVLDAAPLVDRRRMRLIELDLPIGEAARIETRMRAQGTRIESVDYQADRVRLRIAVPDEPAELDAMLTALAAITAGEASPVLGGVVWHDLEAASRR